MIFHKHKLLARESRILESLIDFIGWKTGDSPFEEIFKLQILCSKTLGICM